MTSLNKLAKQVNLKSIDVWWSSVTVSLIVKIDTSRTSSFDFIYLLWPVCIGIVRPMSWKNGKTNIQINAMTKIYF